MNNTKEKLSDKKLFVDYKPAELKQTAKNDWRIVFYCKIPGKDKMKRYRRRVPPIKPKTERRKYAKKMIHGINKELEKGWSPLRNRTANKNTRTLISVFENYIRQAERKHSNKTLRKDTLRSYRSFCNNLKKYLEKEGKYEMLCIEFDRSFIIQFLDNLYFENKRSARTSNNYLAFFKQLCIYMVDRDFIGSNPAEKIEKRREGEKKRKVLPDYLLKEVVDYQKKQSKTYLTLCLTVYFCFIRRTEITKLKVKHVNLENDTIFIPSKISKNRIDGVVTIPRKLKTLLNDHIKNASGNDYLFSENEFNPGKQKLRPRKITTEWAKMRKKLGFESKYQFYSLKDTGITKLLMIGVPAKKVRDQARHHDIRITEKYTPESTEADQALLGLDFSFA